MNSISEAREVVFLDFEFRSPKGDFIEAVHCLAAIEQTSGIIHTYDADQLASMTSNPLPTGPDVVYVAFAAAAEWSSFLKLGWKLPQNVIDLRYEFLRWMNGNSAIPKPEKETGIKKTSLLNALRLFGIETATDSGHKTRMREVCIENTVLPAEHKQAVIDYCVEDVRPMLPLLQKILPTAGPLQQVLHRGNYSKVEATIERNGIPIDMESYSSLVGQLQQHIERTVEDHKEQYPFFLPSGLISQKPFAKYLIEHDLPWKRTAAKHLATDAETMREAAEQYPQLAEAYKLVRLFATLQDVSRLPIGSDGRCRYYQNPLGTITSRHAAGLNPFSLKKWVRSLIKPEPGRAIVSADWSSQEIGIAGYLSGDENMKSCFAAAVEGADVYMRFAELSGLVPTGAKREDYELLRSRAKVCFLSANYGAGPYSISDKLGISYGEAKRLLRLYDETFSRYIAWGHEVLNYAYQFGEIQTKYGWRRLITKDIRTDHGRPNSRSIINWPVQSMGAEIMRIAALLCRDNGLNICGTVHDSIVVECSADDVDQVAESMKIIMNDATVSTLNMPSAVDVTTAIYPNRYYDKDGKEDWLRHCQQFGLKD